jgi:ATP:ADP antiporter, AAA family
MPTKPEMTAPSMETRLPGPVGRFLRLFTDIRAGETPKALLLTLNIYLLLLAYYLIKPVREALLLIDPNAPRIKSYLSGAQAILLVLVIKAFSHLASKVPRHILITYVTLFFISNLVLFYILSVLGVGAGSMGIVFFIWIGIFNLLVVAQFWGFANDLYSDEAGKRLFPLIAFGATLGAVSGSRIAEWLMVPVGSYGLMLVTAAILVLCIGLAVLIHRREVGSPERPGPVCGASPARSPDAQMSPLKKGGGFRLIFRSRYLLYIALLIGVYNFINSTGEYILSDIATRSALKAIQSGTAGGLTMGQIVGKFFAEYHFLANILALVIQLFLVSRIFKWVGIGGALLFLPLISLGGYGWIAFGAPLLLVKWVKSLENGTDYSLMNTTKAALFLITPREEKYKAKAAIDTFFVRGGDAVAALAVFVGTTFFALRIERYAAINVFLVVIWIGLSLLIAKEYKKRKADVSGSGL